MSLKPTRYIEIPYDMSYEEDSLISESTKISISTKQRPKEEGDKWKAEEWESPFCGFRPPHRFDLQEKKRTLNWMSDGVKNDFIILWFTKKMKKMWGIYFVFDQAPF